MTGARRPTTAERAAIRDVWAVLAIMALGIAIAVATTGCLPTLTAESTAPPGRIARLDTDTGVFGPKRYRIELSQGVALAVSCDHFGPCDQLTAQSDNPAIADVRPAALAVLRAAPYGNQQTAAAVVIVAHAPGATTVRLHSRDGDRNIPLTVVPPPPPPPPQTPHGQPPRVSAREPRR